MGTRDNRISASHSTFLTSLRQVSFLSESSLSVVSAMVMWNAASGLERIYKCGVLVKRTPGKDRCTGRRDITEILLKTALHTSLLSQCPQDGREPDLKLG